MFFYKKSLSLPCHNIRSYVSIAKNQLCSPDKNQPPKPAAPNPHDTLRVCKDDARRFMVECLVAMKTPKCHAEQQADLLLAADLRGHYSHGMNRLEMYVNDLEKGSCCAEATATIVKETPATAWVDGCNGLGAVSGNFCMQLAIKKAKDCGIGFVAARNTNHYGISGWYTMQAQREGLLGWSTTNTSPFMAPTRSKKACLGTNPISLAAPAHDDSFVLDMATSAVAVGKIEIARRKGVSIPHGWAQGPDGKSTTDTNLAMKTATVMPLGGIELNSGYKGYGLGVLVDILGGVLAGAHYGLKIRKWAIGGSTDVADLGQSFMAINPDCFAPDFQDRMADFIKMLRTLPPQEKDKPVLIAGDPERLHIKKVKKEGGLAYVENQIITCKKLSEKLKVKPLTQFPMKTGKCV